MRNMLFICMLCLMSALYAQQALAEKQQHKEYAEMKISECNDCHKGEGVALNHDGDWTRNHRTVASKANNNCGQCHTQSFCLDCHQGGGINADLSRSNFGRDYVPKSHRSDFVNLHPLKAQDNPQTCYRCHDQKYCNSCHARFPKGSLRIKSHLMLGPNNQQYAPALGEHAIEARRNLQSCQTCHPEGDVCIQCHSSGKTNPHPRNWKGISSNYKDKAGSKVCLKCHVPGTF
ncbi:cytochrome c [Citrifermentans bemidjiense Bem]|uniref:Cytochrome c n=1 Tax=Citrifermentans bemidjiense (strain ATCC BAA-1014 / DSM 16622 / JCM 12645 / Bem) TaxID=404380 RepID=B5EB83_CITBB|nr:cytochrome c3 family protein [Citrifermentans bemidjiense]ACH40375.1 cytochrome c [Citrifermentans bemidjiense Bem]